MTGTIKNRAAAEAAFPEEAATPVEEAIPVAAEAVIPVAVAVHHSTHPEQELLMEDHPEEQVPEDTRNSLNQHKNQIYISRNLVFYLFTASVLFFL